MIVPGARDFCMQPYTSSLARCRAWESPAGALLQSVSQLFGRAADAVASRILCSLFSPASTYEHRGDAPAAIGSQAHAIIDASLSREMSRNIRVERWGGLCRRIHASEQKNQFYAFAACSASACCKNILLVPPFGGAARCGGPAASPLAALVCKMPSRGRGAG